MPHVSLCFLLSLCCVSEQYNSCLSFSLSTHRLLERDEHRRSDEEELRVISAKGDGSVLCVNV